MAESDQGKRKRASNQPTSSVTHLESALERSARTALANQEDEVIEQKPSKPATQDHVPPRITGAMLMQSFPHDMQIARERRLTALARKHPEIKSAIQLSTK